MVRSVRKELRLSPEFADAVDRVRGDVSFNRFVERALEQALGGAVCRDAGGAPSSEAGLSPIPAPARAPDPAEYRDRHNTAHVSGHQAGSVGGTLRPPYVKPFRPSPKK